VPTGKKVKKKYNIVRSKKNIYIFITILDVFKKKIFLKKHITNSGNFLPFCRWSVIQLVSLLKFCPKDKKRPPFLKVFLKIYE